MAFQVTEGPALEPLTTDQAREHLRVDLGLEDALIDAAVVAARTYAEGFMRRKLITQTIKITQTGLCAPIWMPFMPVQSVTQVQYKRASDGVLTTLAADQYQLVKSSSPYFIAPAYQVSWPTVRADFDSVEITIVCGYGDEPDDIPGDIMAAIKLLLGHFYENRQNELAGNIISKVTLGAEALMMPYRVHI